MVVAGFCRMGTTWPISSRANSESFTMWPWKPYLPQSGPIIFVIRRTARTVPAWRQGRTQCPPTFWNQAGTARTGGWRRAVPGLCHALVVAAPPAHGGAAASPGGLIPRLRLFYPRSQDDQHEPAMTRFPGWRFVLHACLPVTECVALIRRGKAAGRCLCDSCAGEQQGHCDRVHALLTSITYPMTSL